MAFGYQFGNLRRSSSDARSSTKNFRGWKEKAAYSEIFIFHIRMTIIRVSISRRRFKKVKKILI